MLLGDGTGGGGEYVELKIVLHRIEVIKECLYVCQAGEHREREREIDPHNRLFIYFLFYFIFYFIFYF